MHTSLNALMTELKACAAQTIAVVSFTQPFNIQHNNWSFPGCTRQDVAEMFERLAGLLSKYDVEEPAVKPEILAQATTALKFLRENTLGNLPNSPQTAMPVIESTVAATEALIRKAIAPALEPDSQRAIETFKRLTNSLTRMEESLSAIEPRVAAMDEFMRNIEDAHGLANELHPTITALNQAKADVLSAKKAVDDMKAAAGSAAKDAIGHLDKLKTQADDAETLMKQCQATYRAATSNALSGAFASRATALGWSVWVWSGLLVAALGAGSYYGSGHLQTVLQAVAGQGKFDVSFASSLFASIFMVGASVWFSWVATKQIGHRFKLAEDYSYKATISAAYEGYRQEAVGLDASFLQRLFGTALTRLEELPLRVVDDHAHGSPLHELLNSAVVRQAVGAIPDFLQQATSTVEGLAKEALNKLPGKKEGAAPSSQQLPVATQGEKAV